MLKAAKLRKIHRVWRDNFLNNCHKLNKSEHTIINYRCDLQKFLTWYEATHYQNINKANATTIEAYKDYLSGVPSVLKKRPQDFINKWFRNKDYKREILHDPLSVSSKRRHLSSVKNFFEFLIQYYEDHGRIFRANPVRPKLHAIKLKDIDVNHTKLLRDRDWYQLEKVVQTPKERLIVYLLYYGGLRLEEITRLKVDNFSLANRTLTFVRKGGEIHTLKLAEFDCIIQLLRDYLNERKYRHNELFTNRFGRQLSSRSMYSIIKRLLKRAHLNSNLGPHSFRKACATNMYKQTKDILLVRDYLNHKDAKITQTYIET